MIDEPIAGSNDMGHDLGTSAGPLQLCVTVHTDGEIHRQERLGPTQRIIVKINPNTPFKILSDKLLEKWGDHELRLSELPCEYVFDSDTPASISKSSTDVGFFITDTCYD
jgi:hypothetical protein